MNPLLICPVCKKQFPDEDSYLTHLRVEETKPLSKKNEVYQIIFLLQNLNREIKFIRTQLEEEINKKSSWAKKKRTHNFINF